MRGWLSRRDTISEKVARRFIEMYEEGRRGYEAVDWTQRRLSDDAKPVVIDFCLRLLRESIEPSERWNALQGLRNIGDVSVITELQEIARSPDAEGIEDQLARTIQDLERRGTQPR